MNSLTVSFQIHKYKNGHQLVASTIELERPDQDTIDRLSDLSGQLRPGELFAPYFTCYPLPSEKYFIIARTWQDLTAVRAGCVLTKSCIIPMEEWENTTQVPSVFETLFNSLPDLSFPLIDFITDSHYYPVSASPIEELVEALFLEKRKPILIIDGKEKDQIIIRLYSVFWPTIRRKFAICTFALAPRTVNNRLFDLLFTENALRNRFSDWNGRRIEGSSNDRKAARHRWTIDLAHRVFKTDNPSLYKKGGNSPFDLFTAGDESILRLSLLWDELMKKAVFEQSPMAILGLLDIVNSQPSISGILYQNIEAQIMVAINNAPKSLTVDEAWKFYGGLLVKHKRKLMGRDMLNEVKNACTSLTLTNPVLSIEFILNYNPSLEKIPSILYASIGDGIAKKFKEDQKLYLDKIPNNLGLFLLATSPDFASMLMTLLSNDINQVNAAIMSYFEIPDLKALQRAKNNLLPLIKFPVHKQILVLQFRDSSPEQYKKVLLNLAERTRLEFDDFDELIFKETVKHKEIEFLLEILLTVRKVNFLMVKILLLQPTLIKKVFADKRISPNQKDKILIETISSLKYETLVALSSDPIVSKEIYQLLLKSKTVKKEILAEYALLMDVPALESLSIIDTLTTESTNLIRQEKLFNLLEQSMGSSFLESQILSIISKFNIENADKFVALILTDYIKFANVDFEIVSSAHSKIQKSLVNQIDIISEILAENLPEVTSKRITENWIQLLETSNELEKQRWAAAKMLEYSFKLRRSDPTNLIIASFPIVYKTFLGGKSMTKSITFWIFPDWDRCKTLRHSLVDHYLKSNWSRFGLIEVAYKTGILDEVISILNDSKKGQKFLRDGLKEVDRFSGPIQKSLSRQLKHNKKDK